MYVEDCFNLEFLINSVFTSTPRRPTYSLQNLCGCILQCK